MLNKKATTTKVFKTLMHEKQFWKQINPNSNSFNKETRKIHWTFSKPKDWH